MRLRATRQDRLTQGQKTVCPVPISVISSAVHFFSLPRVTTGMRDFFFQAPRNFLSQSAIIPLRGVTSSRSLLERYSTRRAVMYQGTKALVREALSGSTNKPMRLASASSLLRAWHYRDLTHKTSWSGLFGTLVRIVLTKNINALQIATQPLALISSDFPATHKKARTYRALTHIFTVLSPTFFPSVRFFVAPTHPWFLRPLALMAVPTVLSPTFLPFLDPRCYRALTHGSTVLSPTGTSGLTVLSPTNVGPKGSIRHSISPLKDVLKIDLKNTSPSLLMFLFRFIGFKHYPSLRSNTP
jgi:hypothetical protein